MWRFIIIALTLICLVLLGWYAVRKVPGRVESDIQARAQAALAAKGPGVAGVVVKASQRDLVLDGAIASEGDRQVAVKLLAELSGVKSVTDQLDIAGTQPPTPAPPEPDDQARTDVIEAPSPDAASDATAEADAAGGTADATALSADVPGEIAAAAADADAGPEAPEVAAADTAAPGVAAADTAAPEVALVDPTPAAASAVDPGGPLTPKQCAAIIAAAVEGDKRIKFRSNTGRLTEEGEEKVKEVASILARCPTATGVIEGYHDDYGEPDRIKQLSQIRAFNVHKRLGELGIDTKRFKYVGLGYRNMRYHGVPAVRILNQRVEFNITVE